MLALPSTTSENLFNFIIENYGCINKTMRTLFDCLKKKDVSRRHFWDTKVFDADKVNLNIIEFLRFIIQLCT